MNEPLNRLKEKLDQVNVQLLELLSEHALLMRQIGTVRQECEKDELQVSVERMLDDAVARNGGPLDGTAIRELFKHIFKASLDLRQNARKGPLLVSRKSLQADTIVLAKQVAIGGEAHAMIAGPCSVESYGQLRAVASALKEAGVRIIRGGAYKPRTSPYDFQGLGIEGLKMLKEVADEFGLVTISEIVDPAHIETAADYIDIIQIGARNMHNFELLKAAGEAPIPVLLKRGLAATLDEFLHAAEYIVSRGNSQVMLIERGIRTYEKWTRNTLDISAVPILKQESHLPVLVDVSHSTGRKDILAPCAKAALAAGADGIMVEVHPDPPAALSDAEQQLNIEQFRQFYRDVLNSGLFKTEANSSRVPSSYKV